MKTQQMTATITKSSEKAALEAQLVAQRRQAYQLILGLRTLNQRLGDGTQSNLEEDDDGWLLKSDQKDGELFVGHEFSVYERLQGLGVAPEADLEAGVFGSPDTIRIKKVNNGGTLLEYANLYLSGLLSEGLWIELCAEVRGIMTVFFDEGWVHGDMHAKNIVIELNPQGRWSAYLIDFGVSFNENFLDEDLGDLKDRYIVFERVPSQQEDIEYLLQDLNDLEEADGTLGFTRGLNELFYDAN